MGNCNSCSNHSSPCERKKNGDIMNQLMDEVNEPQQQVPPPSSTDETLLPPPENAPNVTQWGQRDQEEEKTSQADENDIVDQTPVTNDKGRGESSSRTQQQNQHTKLTRSAFDRRIFSWLENSRPPSISSFSDDGIDEQPAPADAGRLYAVTKSNERHTSVAPIYGGGNRRRFTRSDFLPVKRMESPSSLPSTAQKAIAALQEHYSSSDDEEEEELIITPNSNNIHYDDSSTAEDDDDDDDDDGDISSSLVEDDDLATGIDVEKNLDDTNNRTKVGHHQHHHPLIAPSQKE